MRNALIAAARKVAALIEDDRAREFAALRHVMRFEAMGLGGEDIVVVGDVFQRAQLLDTMIDAAPWHGGQSRAALDHECAGLVDRRRRTGIGGWSYFPEFPLLAPDADDLAEMMRVLTRLGAYDIVRTHCTAALAVLFEDCAHGDGAFETWIIPKRDRTPEQEMQAWAATTLWGTGADLAVVANVADAVRTAASALDPSAIAAAARAQGYVTRQVTEGNIDSAWYVGSFYPAFAAARALPPDAPEARAAIIGHLAERQHADGGWGMTGSSDALSTALALLALFHADRSCPATDAGVVALLAMTSTLTCDATPFIRMDTGRTLGIAGRIETYGSVTNTANFVLKAIVTTLARGFSS